MVMWSIKVDVEFPLRIKPPTVFRFVQLFDSQLTLTQAELAEVFGVMAVAAKPFCGDYEAAKQFVLDYGPHTFEVEASPQYDRLVSSPSFRTEVSRAAYRLAYNRTDAGWLAQCITGRPDPGNYCTLDKMWPLPNVRLLNG